MKDDLNTPIIMIASYRPDEYDAVRTSALDAFSLDKTFKEWQVKSNKAVNLLISEGKIVRKVDFDNAHFVRWASAHKVQSTQQTRIAFCVEIASGDKHRI